MTTKKYENINHSPVLCADYFHKEGLLAIGQQLHESKSNLWIFSTDGDSLTEIYQHRFRNDINTISFSESGKSVFINGFPSGLLEIDYDNNILVDGDFGNVQLIQLISDNNFIVIDSHIWIYNAELKEKKEILEGYKVGKIQSKHPPQMNFDMGAKYLPYINELPSIEVSVEERMVFVSGFNEPKVNVYNLDFDLLDEIPFPSFQTSNIIYRSQTKLLSSNSLIPSAIFVYNIEENKFQRSDLFNAVIGDSAQIEMDEKGSIVCTGSHIGGITFYNLFNEGELNSYKLHNSFISFLKYDPRKNIWISSSHDGTIGITKFK